jgi:FAD/FMN-containing dehydrogenase
VLSAGLELIGPDDPAYDQARRTFNGTIDRRPALIARPEGTAAVQEAISLAIDRGLPVSVRGGGHSVAGHSVADGALMIDLSRMRGVTVDPDRRRARVGGGALWEDVDSRALEHDMAVPGGTFADTGVAGLALGGGLGWLLGTTGLTCDNLIGAEVVTADGEIATAGSDGDADLLWALRGGGGNFGVVTEFEFALHPLRPLYAGYLLMPPDRDSLRALFDVAASSPPELGLMPTLSRIPDTDERSLNVGLCFQGSRADGERIVAPLRRRKPIYDDVAVRTYQSVQDMNGRLPFGMRHYWKGHFTTELDDGAIEVLLAVHAQRPVGTQSTLLMERIHGQAQREPDGGAAFGQRHASWNVSALAIWTEPADDERSIRWSRETVAALAPYSIAGAGYGNYAPPDEPIERIQAGFGPERYERLRQVKRRYDPTNRFRFNHNIAS